MEQLGGDDLAIFKKMRGFELRPGTGFEEAQEIAEYLNSKLRAMSETAFPEEA